MVIVFLADGFEESEAICPIDILIRAGFDVKTVSVTSEKTVVGAHSIPIIADLTVDQLRIDTDSLDAVILPGGMPGTQNLLNSTHVTDTVKSAYANGKTVCAICAAPIVLAAAGILEGKSATCFPGFEDRLTGAIFTDSPVVTDGKIITAKGMGAAYRFGLEIVSELCGEEKARTLAESMIYS